MRILTAIVALLAFSEPAIGCIKSPWVGVAENAAEYLKSDDVVFSGRVVLYEPLEVSDEFIEVVREETGDDAVRTVLRRSKDLMVAKFAVDTVWKGEVSDSFVALNDISWQCSYSLKIGVRYVVFGQNTDIGTYISRLVAEDQIPQAKKNLDRALQDNDT